MSQRGSYLQTNSYPRLCWWSWSWNSSTTIWRIAVEQGAALRTALARSHMLAIVSPPSTTRLAPVTYAPAAELRYATA